MDDGGNATDVLLLSLAALAACAIVFVIVLAINYICAHDDTFTQEEQYAAANVLCASHGGVREFDDEDSYGSGAGPANVICGDGFISDVTDPHPDPDPGSGNPYGPNEAWWRPF